MDRKEFHQQVMGTPYLQSDEEREKELRKAKEHERSFGKKQNSDIIKKRMDSDLFKGGWK